jgi:hypothetical protein
VAKAYQWLQACMLQASAQAAGYLRAFLFAALPPPLLSRCSSSSLKNADYCDSMGMTTLHYLSTILTMTRRPSVGSGTTKTSTNRPPAPATTIHFIHSS